MHEMVTGSKPRCGDDGRPRLDRASSLNVRWRTVIGRCLAADPSARFATAGAAIRALQSSRPKVRAVVLATTIAGLVSLAGVILSRKTIVEDHIESSEAWLAVSAASRKEAGSWFIAGDWRAAIDRFEAEFTLLDQPARPGLELELLNDLVTAHTKIGNVERARALVRQGLATCRRIDDRAQARVMQILAAGILLADGDVAVAERRLRQLAASADSGNAGERVLLVSHWMRASIDRGDFAAARDVYARLQPGDLERRYRFRMEIAALRDTAYGVLPESENVTESVMQSIRNHRERGRIVYALDFEHALGEILLARGDEAQGRARLTRLREEATALGYGTVATRAARRLELIGP